MKITNNIETYLEGLSAPFENNEILWLPDMLQKNSNSMKVVPYTDARTIFKRLDDVVRGNWDYEESEPKFFTVPHLSNQNIILKAGWYVRATLTIDGVTRQEIGTSYIKFRKSTERVYEEGKEPYDKNLTDEEIAEKYLAEAAQLDPKTAASDATKRVGMLFGIGRYLWTYKKPIFVPKGTKTYEIASKINQKDYEALYNWGLETQYKAKPSITNEHVAYLLKIVSEKPETIENVLKQLENNPDNFWAKLSERLNKE